jgi:hypothetical protein
VSWKESGLGREEERTEERRREERRRERGFTGPSPTLVAIGWPPFPHRSFSLDKKNSFPRTKTLNFKVGHVLKDHAHKKRGYKRVGIAEGGKFIIRPKGWSGAAAAERAEAAATSASLSDVELSPGDAVDIPPGLLHAAWVVGDEAVVFIMGDEEEGE